MKVRSRQGWSSLVLVGAFFWAFLPDAAAQVVVTIDGDTAYATISLTDTNGITYDADVTIAFDTPQNLSVQSLNLTAELVDPDDVQGRLPPDICGLLPPHPCITVDPAFPMMITVEPPAFPWLFTSGFDGDETGAGDLAFLNTYEFEIHTHDLAYTPMSPYRLFKAPLGGQFDDITDDVLSGSVRARGRHGAFSQFMVVKDTRCDLTVSLGKIVLLNLRILSAALDDVLRGDLLGLLAQVDALLVTGLLGPAIDTLDLLIADIDAHAGTDIANVWRAERDVVNDAGEMQSLAHSLRFSMVRAQGAPLCLGLSNN